MRHYSLFLIICVAFVSCVKDKPTAAASHTAQLSGAKKVYVLNEGGFGYGNGSVSLYDPGNGSVIEDLYKSQNNSDLGDVAQSLSMINFKFYVVVNNSNKIVVCDAEFKKTGQINGLGSPRYVLPVTNQKAYVSDYNSNALSIVDLNTNAKTGSIAMNGWSEKMILIYNKAFVTNIRKEFVYIINTVNDTKTDSVEVGINAASVVLDKQDKVWVLSAGDQANAKVAKLSRINPVNHQIELSLNFVSGSPGNLCLNKTKDTLYYLNGDVYRMAITETALPTQALISKGNKNFYGLGINPNDYSIYVADALDYSQKSNIYIYSSTGEQKFFFKAGIIANSFYFE